MPGKLVPSLLLALLAGTASAGDEEIIRAATLAKLGEVQPAVKWDAASVISVDVTCDRRPDRIALGYGPDGSAWIGLLPYGAKPISLSFPIGKQGSGSFCKAPLALATAQIPCSDEPDRQLPSCQEVKGCLSFSVLDAGCDAMHFFWDAKRRRLVWVQRGGE